jgi:hypothetical protein
MSHPEEWVLVSVVLSLHRGRSMPLPSSMCSKGELPNYCRTDHEATSGQYDLTSFRFRVVYHSTLIVPNHRSVGFRICHRPLQARYARFAGCCKRGPGSRHILCQYLRFGRIHGSLFATLRIIEAELEVGCVPCARQSIENRVLPSEVVSEGRRCVELMLQSPRRETCSARV